MEPVSAAQLMPPQRLGHRLPRQLNSEPAETLHTSSGR